MQADDITTEIDIYRADGGLLNAFGALIGNRSTGLGQFGRDKYLDNHVSVYVPTLDRSELNSLYRQNKICQKVVDLLPTAATSKNWIEIVLGRGRKNVPPKLLKMAESLGFRDYVREAAICGRLDGDGFIILGIDDGQSPDMPVNEARIRQISWIQSVDRYCLTPLPNSGLPGNPDYYQLSLPRNQMKEEGMTYGRIHRSRILRFPGKRLYGRLIEENSHFNDSSLLAFYASFTRYLVALEYSVRMVQDYDTFVYKLKGLAQLVLMGKEEDILKRFRAILLSKSALGGIAMDGEGEDAAYVSRNFSGLDALIDRLKDDTAAAADMPPTKLWGSSQKTALSNSAEGDKYEWSDCVSDYQSETLDEPVTEFFRLLMLAQNSPTGGRVPDDWAVKYRSVLRLNLKEQVELRAKQTKEVDLPSIAAGTLSQEEVRQGAWGGSEYSIERTLLSAELPVTPREKQQQAKQSQPTEPNPQQKQDALRNDDSTPAKRIIDFQGFKLGLQYLPFDQRHGRLLPVAYGHIRGTKGADGMAVDCYVGSNLLSEKVYAIAQVIDGKFDEEKLMLGFDSPEQAEQIYKQVMPPEFFGGIREMKVSEIAQYRKDAAEVFQVEGEVLSDREFEELANVDRSDIEAALNEWRSNSPKKFKGLLDAE